MRKNQRSVFVLFAAISDCPAFNDATALRIAARGFVPLVDAP